MARVSSGNASFELPPGWGQHSDGHLLTIGAPALHGYQPNVVVRESRTTARLAALSQATLAAIAGELEDACVYRVEAQDGPDGERRRTHILFTTLLEGMQVTVWALQDLFVGDGVAIEATATVPLLFGQEIRDDLTAVLDSLRLNPPSQRTTPATTADVPAPSLDDEASARAQRPMESLAALHGKQRFAMTPNQRRISPDALAALEDVLGGGRLFQPRVPRGTQAYDILLACELIERDGSLSPAGNRVAQLRRQGRAWSIERDQGSRHRRLRGWTHEGQTLVIADPTPVDDARGWDDVVRIDVLGPDELLRVAYTWSDLTPAWPREDELPAFGIETLLSKVAGHSRLPASVEGPLAQAPWEYLVASVEGAADNVAWIWADGVGPALFRPEGDRFVVTCHGATELPERLFRYLGENLTLTESPLTVGGK